MKKPNNKFESVTVDLARAIKSSKAADAEVARLETQQATKEERRESLKAKFKERDAAELAVLDSELRLLPERIEAAEARANKALERLTEVAKDGLEIARLELFGKEIERTLAAAKKAVLPFCFDVNEAINFASGCYAVRVVTQRLARLQGLIGSDNPPSFHAGAAEVLRLLNEAAAKPGQKKRSNR